MPDDAASDPDGPPVKAARRSRNGVRPVPDERMLASRYSVYVDEVQRLIKAGIEVMKRSEDSNPRVSDVVKEAGLSNEAFYRHFKSKDDLLLAILEDGQRLLVGYLEHQMAKERTGIDKVRRWIESIMSQAMDATAAEGTRSAVVHSMRIKDVFPQEASRHSRLITQPLRDALVLGVEDGTIGACDPAATAQFIHFLVNTAMQHAVLLRERPSAVDVAELIDFVFHGLDVGGPGTAAGDRSMANAEPA